MRRWVTPFAGRRIFPRAPGKPPYRPPENGLKVDADEDGVGGDDSADCLRYLVATKGRTVSARKLKGL